MMLMCGVLLCVIVVFYLSLFLSVVEVSVMLCVGLSMVWVKGFIGLS